MFSDLEIFPFSQFSHVQQPLHHQDFAIWNGADRFAFAVQEHESQSKYHTQVLEGLHPYSYHKRTAVHHHKNQRSPFHIFAQNLCLKLSNRSSLRRCNTV